MSRVDVMRKPRICVFVHHCPHGDELIEVAVRKVWWGGPGHGGQGRELYRFCIPYGDANEAERIALGLEAAAAALRG